MSHFSQTDMQQNPVPLIDMPFYFKTCCLPPVGLDQRDAAFPRKS